MGFKQTIELLKEQLVEVRVTIDNLQDESRLHYQRARGVDREIGDLTDRANGLSTAIEALSYQEKTT